MALETAVGFREVEGGSRKRLVSIFSIELAKVNLRDEKELASRAAGIEEHL